MQFPVLHPLENTTDMKSRVSLVGTLISLGAIVSGILLTYLDPQQPAARPSSQARFCPERPASSATVSNGSSDSGGESKQLC
jgi:hypothetical protein